MCGCCAPVRLKIKEARGQNKDEEAAEDANIVDGGDMNESDEEGGVETEGPAKV